MKKKIINALVVSFAFFFYSKIATLHAVCDQAWAGDSFGTVLIFDTNTQTQIASFSIGEVTGEIAFTPDGSQAYLVADTTLGVVNTSTLAFSTIDATANYTDVTVAPDGKFAFAANEGFGPMAGFISKINTQTNAVSILLNTTHMFQPHGVVVSPDGTKLYVPGFDLNTSHAEIWVVDANNGNVLQMATLPGISNTSQIQITPDGLFVYVTDAGTNTVVKVNTTTLAMNLVSTGAFPPFNVVMGITIDPAGQFAYVTNFGDNSVDVIQISSNTVVAHLTDPSLIFPRGIAITPNGKFVYVANFSSMPVTVINTSNFAITTIAHSPGNLIPMAMAPACFAGQVKGLTGKNSDFWQTDIFANLCWTLSTSTIPKNFLVYRNGKRIATLLGTVFSFEDHYLKHDKQYVYSIYASNAPGIRVLIGRITLETD